jgi:hypothetical protein
MLSSTLLCFRCESSGASILNSGTYSKGCQRKQFTNQIANTFDAIMFSNARQKRVIVRSRGLGVGATNTRFHGLRNQDSRDYHRLISALRRGSKSHEFDTRLSPEQLPGSSSSQAVTEHRRDKQADKY